VKVPPHLEGGGGGGWAATTGFPSPLSLVQYMIDVHVMKLLPHTFEDFQKLPGILERSLLLSFPGPKLLQKGSF